MITILANIFLKNKDINDTKNRKSYGTLCGIVGIILNIFLFFIKYFAGVVSGSVAIMADAFNNLSDAGSSFITLVGFVFAGKKPDTDHPFGHGRFEYVSGFIVSMAIILMGLELFKSSFDKILHPQVVEGGITAIIILVTSILVKLYMAFYNTKIGKKIDSAAMKATAMDSLSDTVATTFVLLSVIVLKITGLNIDGICGLLVAVFILYSGIMAAKDTISPLLGQTPEPEFVNQIEDIVMSHSLVRGIHDLIVHDYGPGRVMISLHAEVPGDGDIFELHDMIDLIENELNEKLYCEAVIHMDPVETNNAIVIEKKIMVSEKLKELDKNISIHDFRMVAGPTHTNIIFDVVMPFENKMNKDDFIAQIQDKVKEIDATYVAVVHIDRSYVLSH